MPIASESKNDFKPVSAGSKGARCFGVIALGTQMPNIPKYRPQKKVLIMWEIPEETYELEGKTIPMTIMREYSLTLGRANKESNLRKDLNSWRGRPFTEQEAAGFDVKNLLNAPCLLSITHYTGDDGNTKAKVTGVMALPKLMTVPELTHEPIHYEIEMGKGREFDALPKWIQTKISGCLEWNPTETVSASAPPVTAEEDPQEVDDVPFAFIAPWLPFIGGAATALLS